MKLLKNLEHLGMDKKQAKVYLTSLELGMARASEIANKTSLERTTVYDILEKLSKDGLMSSFSKKGVKYFMAENPERIRKSLQEKQVEIEAILPELKSLLNTTGIKPKIKYYEGVAGIKTVLGDIIISPEKNLLGILSMVDLYDLLGQKFVDKHVAERIKSGKRLKVLRTKLKDTNKNWKSSEEELRELRFVPTGMAFDMTMYIYDNKLTLISSKKENFGMIIESAELANNMRNLFTTLWSISMSDT